MHTPPRPGSPSPSDSRRSSASSSLNTSMTSLDSIAPHSVSQAPTQRQANINFAFLNLDHAGQTSLLRGLAGQPFQYLSKPTIGLDFNVLNLEGRNLCLWDIPFSERYSISSFGGKKLPLFHGVFFTATHTMSVGAQLQISQWKNWCTKFVPDSTPKILILTRCDEHWNIDIDPFKKLAIEMKLTAIIEVDWCNMRRIQGIMQQIANRTLLANELHIYRYWGEELRFDFNGTPKPI